MIYLDYNASTPLDPEVQKAMAAVDSWAVNPGSLQHSAGLRTSEFLEAARDELANLVGVNSQEIIFTSGSSEAISLVMLGVAAKLPRSRKKFVVAASEHKAVLNAAEMASEYFGIEVIKIDVDQQGLVDANELEQILSLDDCGLVAVMRANNETGVINDTQKIAELAHKFGSLYLCDVTQSFGKEPSNAIFEHSDFCVASAHKIYGPKGIGFLYASRDVQRQVAPLLVGGGQERGLRGGTQNVPAAVGLATASKLALENLDTYNLKISKLVSQFRDGLSGLDLQIVEIGGGSPRLPNTLNLRFVGIEADALIANLANVQVSTGSACNSAVVEPSHVLLSYGLTVVEANECIRVSFGAPTTSRDVVLALEDIYLSIESVKSFNREGSL